MLHNDHRLVFFHSFAAAGAHKESRPVSGAVNESVVVVEGTTVIEATAPETGISKRFDFDRAMQSLDPAASGYATQESLFASLGVCDKINYI